MYTSTVMPRRIILLSIAALISVFASTSAAQFSSVDPTFEAVPSSPMTSASGLSHIVQPDGKIVLFGMKNVVDGVAKGTAFRLNTDGTLDNTFSYCNCVITTMISMRLLPDGKFIVTGSSGTAGIIMRLNADGSQDPSFLVSTPATPFGGTQYTIEAVQPDGKVFAMNRSSAFGTTSFGLYRYNTNGTQDATFTPMSIAVGSPMSAYIRIALLPDGRFYLAVTTGVSGTGSTLKRYMSNGSIDPGYEIPSFTTSGFPPSTFITDIGLMADQSLAVSGKFSNVNGAAKANLVKLLPGGNVDLNFGNINVLFGSTLRILPDGKILFAGNIDVGGGIKLFRLNSNGTVDNGFALDPSVTSLYSGYYETDSAGRVIFLANSAVPTIQLVRTDPNGTRDLTLNPKIAVYGRVMTTATQPDGKVLMAGVFTEVNGTDRSSFARVNADGTTDATFSPGAAFNAPPHKIILQPDGKILAVGPFQTYDKIPVPGIVRLNTNGTLDNTFSVELSSSPEGIALEPDGQILIAGGFNLVNGTTRTGLARLNSNGSLDNTFNPIIGSPQLNSVIVQPDGKIVFGGFFSGVNGFNRTSVSRLMADGTIDQTFATSGVGGPNSVSIIGDGKFLLTFQTTVVRLNGNGSTDTGFTAPQFLYDGSSQDVALKALAMADGSVLIGGRFTTAGQYARRNFARLSSTGAVDTLFMQTGPDARVSSIEPYSAGKVIVGGDFTVIGATSKSAIARLNIAPFRNETPFDFDGDGRADYTAYRPSSGVWYQLFSNGNPYAAPVFGLVGDIPVPADYDGDGKTDVAIFRPSNGDWWYKSSNNGGQINIHFGQNGDIPMTGDFDGDGRSDLVVYRPTTQQWYRMLIANGQQVQFAFGLPGDKPVSGDFDGDGKTDFAIFRPSTGDWWYAASSAANQHRSIHWGANGDIPSPADFDGDGKTDYAVFRPSNGGWYIYRSSDQTWTIQGFGLDGDRPIAADYDGDGKADIAVFRPSNGVWYLLQSTAGLGGVQWGVATDVVIPNAFIQQ